MSGGSGTFAQLQQKAPPVFEVASVKANLRPPVPGDFVNRANVTTLPQSGDQIPQRLAGQSGLPINRDGVSLFTALQEQLGLKLEPQCAPVDVLVIDSVEKPTTN